SWVSSLVEANTMGTMSTFMTVLLGVKFVVKPVMTTKEGMSEKLTAKQRTIRSLFAGIMIGFICGFVGAGGGMMMLLILTTVLGYELKTAVGTSVFIMAFTAFTGSASHMVIGGMPDVWALIFCVVSTLLWAQIAAKLANKASAKTLNRVTGCVLIVIGIVTIVFNYVS
ncbi:MAG: sulfite exporter TauE/SafE family protein, partial [Faecalibacterium sp.]|nr:sulfite exporter TauE/SafE family protein [Faecalibacterium sp.]